MPLESCEHRAMIRSSLLVLAIAACSSEPSRTERAPAADPAATSKRGAAARGKSAPADFTPSACRPAGAPSALVTSDESPENVAAAQFGEKIAVLWRDGPRAKLALADASGRALGAAVPLDDSEGEGNRSEVDLSVLHVRDRVVLLYRRLRGDRCEIAARRVDAAGTAGAPAVLAVDTCSKNRPVYLAAARGSDVYLAHTKGEGGAGVHLVRWPATGAVEPLATLAEGEGCEVLGLGGAPDGWIAVWRCDGKAFARKFDEAGLPLSAPEEVDDPPVWTGDRLLQSRVRRGALEVRDFPLGAPPTAWRGVDVGASLRTATLGRAGGRLWAFVQRADGGFRLAALGPDGAVAGRPTDVAGFTFDADGRRGLVASIRRRQIMLQPLACE